MPWLRNYFNFRKIGDTLLISNDAGRYMFLSEPDFQVFLHDPGSLRPELARDLAEHLFLTGENRDLFASDVALKVRNQKSYLLAGTQLHIFVLTKRCNQRCIYCQTRVGPGSDTTTDMTPEVAERAVDIALQAPSSSINFEFQGGEPTLNFQTLRHIVEYTENRRAGKEVAYSIVTNLASIDDDMLSYLAERKINISTSLDGPYDLHTNNRPFANGGSFEVFMRNLERARKAGCASIGAIQTTTRYSLGRAREIVDTYVDLGFNSVFIRPLTPLGLARSNWDWVGYTSQKFAIFYVECLNYIVELALRGIAIREGNASIFLKRIFNRRVNHMEFRSPCGGVIGQLAYNYDGSIYTCDEGRMLAEMGDQSFRLGDVFHSSLIDLVENPITKALCIASCLELLPACSQCVYMPYCGTCPVVSYAQYGSLFPQRPGEYRCAIYQGMLDGLFTHLQMGGGAVRSVLEAWAS